MGSVYLEVLAEGTFQDQRTEDLANGRKPPIWLAPWTSPWALSTGLWRCSRGSQTLSPTPLPCWAWSRKTFQGIPSTGNFKGIHFLVLKFHMNAFLKLIYLSACAGSIILVFRSHLPFCKPPSSTPQTDLYIFSPRILVQCIVLLSQHFWGQFNKWHSQCHL